jgi:hypothetical protein
MSVSRKKSKARSPVLRRYPERPARQPEPQGELQVVTVVEMSADEFPGEIAEGYAAACAALGVPASDGGYGLVLDQDTTGARWTRVTTDVEGIRTARSFWHEGLQYGYEPPPGMVRATVPGWPVECSLALLGLPEPHDPPGALRPPDLSELPTQRRAIADDIAAELADTGHQDYKEYAEARRWQALNLGDTDLRPVLPRLIDLRAPIGRGDPAQLTVDRVLGHAWELATAAKPAPGAIRIREAWPRDRVIRATGDGWTLVARTGSPPLLILLADEARSNGAIDVSNADRAHELLDGLTAAADRSSGG